MRQTGTGALAGVAGVLLLSALAAAQGEVPRSPWKYYPEDARANTGPGGPAPIRNLTGTWAGEASGAGVKPGIRPEKPPPLTPLGKQLFDRNRPQGPTVLVANTNDPHLRYCDPFGFPRNMNDQIRSMTITALPERTFVLLAFQTIWREIWTDGRALPTNVGGRGRDAHDPTYNGYSVGRWEDDYTFVVETTGMDPETWATEGGYPHSVEAHVTEFFWVNPHPLIKSDYKDAQGNVQHWTMELGGIVGAQLVGWTRTSLQPGDVVTLYVWQAKTGALVGRFNKVDFADGTTMRDSQTGADDGGRADTGVRQ